MPRHEPIPSFPIAPILEALGAENVPHLHHGHRKMLCPFHNDTTPSASVSKYGFRCFTCDRKGDAISLLREEEGLSFEAAVERATQLTGETSRPIQRGGWGSDLLSDE